MSRIYCCSSNPIPKKKKLDRHEVALLIANHMEKAIKKEMVKASSLKSLERRVQRREKIYPSLNCQYDELNMGSKGVKVTRLTPLESL